MAIVNLVYHNKMANQKTKALEIDLAESFQILFHDQCLKYLIQKKSKYNLYGH